MRRRERIQAVLMERLITRNADWEEIPCVGDVCQGDREVFVLVRDLGEPHPSVGHAMIGSWCPSKWIFKPTCNLEAEQANRALVALGLGDLVWPI
jgi:hypothetical protein